MRAFKLLWVTTGFDVYSPPADSFPSSAGTAVRRFRARESVCSSASNPSSAGTD